MPEAAPTRARLALALAAVVVLNLPLGTVYAFSVFVRPLEAALGTNRAELSFVFGLTLVCFTLGMNLGPPLYRLARMSLLVVLSSLVAGLGLVGAALASGIWGLALGYGVVFGLGGGVAYVLLLQGMNLLLRGKRGLTNGFIVSLYPAGAMLGAPIFGWALGQYGLRATLMGLGATLAVAGLVSALLAARAGMVVLAPAQAALPPPRFMTWLFWRLWAVFFLAAGAGLTVLGQATAMVEAFGGAKALALGATTAVTACMASCRIIGGWLSDRIGVGRVMAGAQALAMLAALLLLAAPGPWLAAVALVVMGTGYGLVSGSTTVAIAEYWGAAQYGRVAGRLYAAWCVAAVTLPVVAGRIFDLSGSYAGGLMLGAAGNLLAVLLAAGLPRRGNPA